MRTIKSGFTVATLGLGLLWAAGCGVGTDPNLLAGADGSTTADGASTPAPDASSLAGTIPPMDQLTYEQTSVATFALG